MNYSFINTSLSPLSESLNNSVENQYPSDTSGTRIYEPTRGSFYTIYNIYGPNSAATIKLNKYFQSGPPPSLLHNASFDESPERFAYSTCEMQLTVSYLSNALITNRFPTYFNLVFNSIYVKNNDSNIQTSGIGTLNDESYKYFTDANDPDALEFTDNYTEGAFGAGPLIPNDNEGNKVATTNIFYSADSGEYFFNFFQRNYRGAMLLKGFFYLY